ncbi:MAG: NAD-dependent epimerase/dehydratase family protein [Elusimicrobiota bacterium]
MSDFWRAKKVVVTGGAGFIGSHLVERLVEFGAEVRAPVRPGRNRRFLAAVLDRIEIVEGNLEEADFCRRALDGQEILMHLAARVGGIEYNMKHPASIFRDNMQVFLNVMEAARQASSLERLLVTSSACVYPRHCRIPTPEEDGFVDVPEPTNQGYGWAKRMEEFLGAAYAQEHRLRVAIARPYNAYGPRDNFRPDSSHVIPAIIRRVWEGGNPLVVWGSGRNSRSFLYVKDFVRGLMDVTQIYPKADPVNLGADEETGIKDLAEMIVELSGKDLSVICDPTKPEGQPRRRCDVQKAVQTIGFKAEIPLREGLKETIRWYQNEILLGSVSS